MLYAMKCHDYTAASYCVSCTVYVTTTLFGFVCLLLLLFWCISLCWQFALILCSWSQFMFYGLEQLDCFQMPTLRFQHWVFLHRTFSWICGIYIYVCGNSVYMCVRIVLIILQNCSEYVYVYILPLFFCNEKCMSQSKWDRALSDARSWNQYIVGWSGLLFSDCPNIKYFCSFL